MTPKYDDQEDKKKSTTQAQELKTTDDSIAKIIQVKSNLPKIKSGLDKERYSVACTGLMKSILIRRMKICLVNIPSQ